VRDYSKVGPRFWTGETGKYLRRLGRDAQVIGFYLFTCPNSNMLGLYYLPLPTLSHETGIELETAQRVLAQLAEAPSKTLERPFEGVFARYDEHSETVFVTEMARHQIGSHLTRKDNRHKAVLKELEQFRKTPFFNDFLRRYRIDFELQDVHLAKDLPSPSGAPSKPGSGAGTETRAGTEHTQDARARSAPDATDPNLDPKNRDAFERVKAGYPEGLYPESDWLIGEREACRRVEEGEPWSEIEAGVLRYRDQVIARGKLGREGVYSPKNFFSPRERRWRDPWPLPAAKAAKERWHPPDYVPPEDESAKGAA